MGKRKNKKAIVTPVNETITLADLEEYAKLCPKGKTTHKTDADVTISAQSQKRICVSILREPRKGLFSTEEYWRLIWACDKKRIYLMPANITNGYKVRFNKRIGVGSIQYDFELLHNELKQMPDWKVDGAFQIDKDTGHHYIDVPFQMEKP